MNSRPAATSILFGLLAAALSAASLAESYKVEDIAFPADAAPQIGGLDFDRNGRLYVIVRIPGTILVADPVADPAGFQWRKFAGGFDSGLGLAVPEPGRIVVVQMAELTEAADTNGDGRADRYRTLADGWGLSGNYHETNALAADGQGGYFVALGTASHRGPTFSHTKGEYSAFGRRGRNYSAVKYRGWIMHARADGELEPFASGFRMHNGLLVDDEGKVWSSDNQGDWKATTPFYHVERGNFYGHPSSLVWDPTWPADKDPLATYRADLASYNAHRTRAAVEIPWEMIQSGSQPVQIPRTGAFGPFGGQILLPDASGERIARLMLEEIDGEFQGAVTLFLAGQGLKASNNRAVFSPSGRELYIGQVTGRGWGGDGPDAQALQRITWTGGVPFTLEKMTITPGGFRLAFTGPVAASALEPASYGVRSMTYQSRWTYGSPPENVRDERVASVTLVDARTVDVALDSLETGRVYHLHLAGAFASSLGDEPAQRDVYYTVNRIPAGKAESPRALERP